MSGSDKKTTTQTTQLPLSSAVTALQVGSHHADTPGCDLMNIGFEKLIIFRQDTANQKIYKHNIF